MAKAALARPTPQRHHVDPFAPAVIGVLAEGDMDDLFTPEQVAEYQRVKISWLNVARSLGYGPPFIKVGPHMIRYRRGDLLKWLRSRVTHHKTIQRRR